MFAVKQLIDVQYLGILVLDLAFQVTIVPEGHGGLLLLVSSVGQHHGRFFFPGRSRVSTICVHAAHRSGYSQQLTVFGGGRKPICKQGWPGLLAERPEEPRFRNEADAYCQMIEAGEQLHGAACLFVLRRRAQISSSW